MLAQHLWWEQAKSLFVTQQKQRCSQLGGQQHVS